MNFKLLGLFSILLLVLNGCNGVGNNDSLIARIGNEKVYEQDVAFLPHGNVAGDSSPELLQEVYEMLEKEALVSAILQKHPEFEKKWKEYSEIIDKRLMALVYQNFFIRENMGYSEKVLERFFRKYKADFDSSATFNQVRPKVAEMYYKSMNKDSLENFVKAQLFLKNVPAKANLVIFDGDSAVVDSVVQLVNGGTSINSVEGTRKIQISANDSVGMFADVVLKNDLIGEKNLEIGKCLFHEWMDQDSKKYSAIVVVSREPEKIAQEEDYRDELEKAFIKARKDFLADELNAYAKNASEYKAESLVSDTLQIYKKHPNLFMTKPGFELSHIAMKDSAALASVKESLDGAGLDSFKVAVGKYSENKQTALFDGYLGNVKVGFTIPYGIGSVANIFDVLQGKNEGFITSIARASGDSLFHIFYLHKAVPAELKSYERVKSSVAAVYLSDIANIDPSTVILTKNGSPLFRERDIQTIYEMETGRKLDSRKNHDLLISIMYGAAIYGDLAKKEKLDHSWVYRALVRQMRRDFISRLFQVEWLAANKLKEGSAAEEFSEAVLTYDFFMEPYLCRGSEFNACKSRLQENRKSRNEEFAYERDRLNMLKGVSSSFYGTRWEGLWPSSASGDILAQAENAAKKLDFNKAVMLYKKAINLYNNDEALLKKNILALAQVYSDNQNYAEAERCYHAYYEIWPTSPEAETAMFSRGFVLNENLHQDKDALAVFMEFKKKYPQSSLKESVDWLVDNIKSEGKLANDLMDKILKSE